MVINLGEEITDLVDRITLITGKSTIEVIKTSLSITFFLYKEIQSGSTVYLQKQNKELREIILK